MELRELRAFVAAGEELHFARAAGTLYMSASTMSELIRRLELELGTALFTRTTRRIVLTQAGSELLTRARTILALTEQATEAVSSVARGETGVIRVGITPPAAPVIAPHLAENFKTGRPQTSVEIKRLWLPDLAAALSAGNVDVAITCGDLGARDPNIETVLLGSEPLLVVLRADDRLATQSTIDFAQLSGRVLGMHAEHLFPAWHLVQRQLLHAARFSPPTIELDDTDLRARLWTLQSDVEWIMSIGSLLDHHHDRVALPLAGCAVPFTLSSSTQATRQPIVRSFVQASLLAELPAGWRAPSPPS